MMVTAKGVRVHIYSFSRGLVLATVLGAAQSACGAPPTLESAQNLPEGVHEHQPNATRMQPQGGADATLQLSMLPIEDLTVRLLQDVSAISGLPIRKAVPVRVLSAADQVAYYEEVSAEAPPPELQAAAEAMERGIAATLEALGLEEASDAEELDLVPALLQLRAWRSRTLSSAQGKNVLGFYDTQRHAFFVRDDLVGDKRSFVVRHELMHALQDQSFDLQAQRQQTMLDVDAWLAYQAVVEGQAMVAAELAAQPGETGLGPVVSRRPTQAPSVAAFPYTEGKAFFDALLASRPQQPFPYWVQQSFARLPRSTREIYHPGVYLRDARFAPSVPVKLDAVLALADQGSEIVWHSAFGELLTQAYLWRSPPAFLLARYMLGDQLAVVRTPTQSEPSLIWLSRWQTPQAAYEFARHAQKLQRMARANTDVDGRRTLVLSYGHAVGIAVGLPPLIDGLPDLQDFLEDAFYADLTAVSQY